MEETTEEQENREELQNKQKTNSKTAVSTYILMIALNINGINTPVKRHRMAKWI